MKIPHILLLAATCFTALVVSRGAEAPVISLWAQGAPGSEAKKSEPEKVVGGNVSNIHNPTITVYLPSADKATGAAVVVAPGGGHVRLAIQHEGYNVGQWLADHGIAAFVLKYRLAKDDAVPAGQSPYTVERDALADAQRAIRTVRSRAQEWKVNPSAVGIIGFSAGGELAALTAMTAGGAQPTATDPLDRPSARPDFQGLIYPGQSQKIQPTKDAPPAFLACGFADRPDISEGLAKVYLLFKQAGVPADLHIYAGAGHGFGVRDTNKSPSSMWLESFRAFLADRKFLGTP